MRRVPLLLLVVAWSLTVPVTAAATDHKDGRDKGQGLSRSEDASRSENASQSRERSQSQGRRGDRTGGVTENNDSDGIPDDLADEGDNRHPSGRDRSVESGRSGEAGGSLSDPDDDGRGPERSNGGPDKPGGSGGVDQADQDWNNGCGNDDDFEDDNEGLCLGRKRSQEARPEISPLFVGAVSEEESADLAAPSLFVGVSIVAETSSSESSSSEPSTEPSSAAPRLGSASVASAPDEPRTAEAPAVETAVASASTPVKSATRGGGPVPGRGGLGVLPLTGLSIGLLVAAGLSLTETGRRMIALSRRKLGGHAPPPLTFENPNTA